MVGIILRRNLESQFRSRLIQYRIPFHNGTDIAYFIEATGKNQILYMTCIDWDSDCFLLIIRIIPVFVFLQFVFEYTMYKVLYRFERTILCTLINDILYRFGA